MARKKKILKVEIRPDYVALDNGNVVPIYKFSPDHSLYTLEPGGDWFELKDRGFLIERWPAMGSYMSDKQLKFLHNCTREMMIEQKKKPKNKRNGCYYMEKEWPIKEWLEHEAKKRQAIIEKYKEKKNKKKV